MTSWATELLLELLPKANRHVSYRVTVWRELVSFVMRAVSSGPVRW
jgi:hypothetical protein